MSQKAYKTLARKKKLVSLYSRTQLRLYIQCFYWLLATKWMWKKLKEGHFSHIKLISMGFFWYVNVCVCANQYIYIILLDASNQCTIPNTVALSHHNICSSFMTPSRMLQFYLSFCVETHCVFLLCCLRNLLPPSPLCLCCAFVQ